MRNLPSDKLMLQHLEDDNEGEYTRDDRETMLQLLLVQASFIETHLVKG